MSRFPIVFYLVAPVTRRADSLIFVPGFAVRPARIADIVGEIAAASDEQRRGIEQVDRTIVQMGLAAQ